MKRAAWSVFFAATTCMAPAQNSDLNAGKTGVGLRLGDPTAITIKKYLTAGKALELNFGRPVYWGYYNYDTNFNSFYDPNNYAYLSYEPSYAIAIQLHYLIHRNVHIDMDGNEKRFQWYYGAGVQFRVVAARYYYRYKNFYGSKPDQFTWVYNNAIASNVDAGADGVLGIEYTFDEVPITVFTDLNLFLELFDHFFYPHFQAGIGARYNF